MTRPHLIIFARAPKMGCAKTRLATARGAVEAMRIYRTSLEAAFRAARCAKLRTNLSLASRQDARDWAWPTEFTRENQPAGDIGARMASALIAHAPASTLLIGSDVLSLKPAHLHRAAELLRTHQLVLGPAEDGGFWLIGMRGPGFARRAFLERAFNAVRWSSKHALADVVGNLGGINFALADWLADCDGD